MMNDVEAVKKGGRGESGYKRCMKIAFILYHTSLAASPGNFGTFVSKSTPAGRRPKSLERSSEKEYMLKQDMKAKVRGKLG